MIVDSLATLNIPAGTILKFAEGENFNASALVVTRYARLFAQGTAASPIILTSVLDDVDDPDDGFEDVDLDGNPSTTGDIVSVPIRGLWGGLVLLGQATTNNNGTNAMKEVEGLNQIFPGDRRILYGGTDDEHSSGVLRYLSIRHTGINVGDQATGNEIQGLTLGAVGRGTTIEYIESYASADDGFEWFGGTVNTRYLVAAFCADDGFDTDEGFRGKGQFWFAIQGVDDTGRAAEMDGATGDEFYQPYSTPVVYNATYIGAGSTSSPGGDGAELIILRDNSAASYYQSIFTEGSGTGLTIEDIDNTGAKTEDSRARLEAGAVKLEGNIWWNFKSGNGLAQFAPQDFAQTYLAGTGNQRITSPLLAGISRDADGGLDPRPNAGSPALTSNVPVSTDAFFTQVTYTGAFGADNWLQGWTALDALGYIGDLATAIEQIDAVPGALTLGRSYPNPATGTSTIEFTLTNAQHVRLALYDVTGREVAVVVDSLQPAGTSRATFDAGTLASGLYIYRLATDRGVQSRTMTVVQ